MNPLDVPRWTWPHVTPCSRGAVGGAGGCCLCGGVEYLRCTALNLLPSPFYGTQKARNLCCFSVCFSVCLSLCVSDDRYPPADDMSQAELPCYMANMAVTLDINATSERSFVGRRGLQTRTADWGGFTGFTGFDGVVPHFESFGWVVNKTLFGVPYDWRVPAFGNQTCRPLSSPCIFLCVSMCLCLSYRTVCLCFGVYVSMCRCVCLCLSYRPRSRLIPFLAVPGYRCGIQHANNKQ